MNKLTAVMAAGTSMFVSFASLAANQEDVLVFSGKDTGAALVGRNYPNLQTFSAGVWVKNPRKGAADYGVILSQGSLGGGSGGFGLYVDAGGSLAFQTRSISAAKVISFAMPGIGTDDLWHFVAITHDWANKVKRLYVDGKVVAEETNPDNLPDPSGTCLFAVGSRYMAGDPPYAFPLSGTVSHVSLWNKALSPEEVGQLMMRVPVASATGLIGYWTLQDGMGKRAANQVASADTLGFVQANAIEWGKDLPPYAALSFVLSADGKKADFTFRASDKPRKLIVAYDVSDRGDDVGAWAQKSEVGTVPAGATTLLSVDLPAGFDVQSPVMRAFIERPLEVRDYVQNGLVALYDAYENAGVGVHDDTAAKWHDLKGGKDVALVTGSDSVTANHIELGRSVRSVSGIFTRFGPMTMEVDFTVASTDDATTGIVPFNVPAIGAIGFDRNAGNKAFAFRSPAYENRSASGIMWWNNPYGNFASFMSAGGSTDVSYTPNYDPNGVVYINGTKYGKSGDTWGIGYDSDLTFYLGAASATLQVRSIRLYDRELTEDERLANHAVDLVRYRGEVQKPVYVSSLNLGYVRKPFAVVALTKAADGKTPVSVTATFTGSDAVRKLCIAWGRKDAGADYMNWANKMELGDVSAGASLASFGIPEDIREELTKSGYRLFLQCPASAKDYVQRGLVALYDAKENAGWGIHEEQTEVWTDLKGGKNIALVGDSDSVTANYIELGRSIRSVSGIFTKFGPMTMEVDFTVTSTDDAMSLILPFNVPGIGGISIERRVENKAFAFRGPAYENRSVSGIMWWDNPYGNFASFMAAGGSADVSYTPNYDPNGIVYIGGTKYAKSGDTYPIAYDGDLTFYLGAAQATLQVRSIRLYDRELTEDERLANHAVNLDRYKSGPMAGHEATEFDKVNRFGMFIVVQ